MMAVDLGIDNFAATVTNTGNRVVLAEGKTVLYVNQQQSRLKFYVEQPTMKTSKRRSVYI